MTLVVAIAVLVAIRDGRDRLIPNSLSGALAAAGVAFQLARLAGAPWALGPVLARLACRLPAPASCLAWALLASALLVAAELVRRRGGRAAGLGMGDVKCLAAWGALLGPWSAVALGAACGLGLLWAVAWRERTFPMGPWLSLAGVATALALALG